MTCFQKNRIGWQDKVSHSFFFFPNVFLVLEDTTIQSMIYQVILTLTREEDVDSLIFAFSKEPRTVLFMRLLFLKDSEWMFARS